MIERCANMRGLDVRTVANMVLDEAQAMGVAVSNLHLNKAVYFMHVDCIRDRGHPLVSAKIEAWQYGPVFREIYNQFKRFKEQAIRSRAQRVDYDSGELVDSRDEVARELSEYIKDLARFYINIPPGMLVDLSHARGGAWDHVWNATGPINAGMEITDDIIREYELPHGQRIART